MNVPFLFLLGVGCLFLAAGCVADDPTDDGSGVVIAEPDARQQATTTPTTGSAASGSDGDTTDETPLEESAASTVPEVLPDPEWADIGFELRPILDTNRALAMAVRPGDDDIWLVEREGTVRIIDGPVDPDGPGGEAAGTVALDITDRVGTDGEGGLLGLDFSPDGGNLYLSYTDTDGNSVIAEYAVDGSGLVEDSARVVLEVEQPFANHNGGQVTVGPDGFLYIALGDGGSSGDPLGSGQDTSTLLGSILRIDPSGGSADNPYAVPADNPFVGQDDSRDEIWLYGVRNPWRFSFDAETGDLWIGDVGQNEIEEIDFLPASATEPAGRGANLGWNIEEGEQEFSGQPAPADLVGPIAWYRHDNGRCSVTGGYVYRGDRIPALDGVYLFADYCTSEVFGIRRFADGRTTQAPLTVAGEIGRIVSFGQGPDGEVYVFEGNGTFSILATAEVSAGQ